IALPDTVVTGGGTVSGTLGRPAVRLWFNAVRHRESQQPATVTQVASGDLALDLSGQRPNLGGRVAIPEMDLRSLSWSAHGPGAGSVKTLAAAFEALARVELDLKPLALIDVDIALEVARWADMPGDMHDLSARLRIDAGQLSAPFTVTIAGAPFEGDLA